MPGNGKPHDAGQSTKIYGQMCNGQPIGKDKEAYTHEKKEKKEMSHGK